MNLTARILATGALALFLNACGGTAAVVVDADGDGDGAHDVDHDEAPAAAATPATAGAVTCDAFATHIRDTMIKTAEAAGDNQYMTVAQQTEMAGMMSEAIRTGCTANNRLGEFPELMACEMAAETMDAFEACKTQPKSDEFDEYMKGIMASAMGRPAAQ